MSSDAAPDRVEALRIDSLHDPRVAAYRAMADPAAIARAGLFVAEGRLVVQRLLEAQRYDVHSVLLTPPAFHALREDLQHAKARAAPGTQPLPIFVVDQSVMDGIVGVNIHRGCLGLARRPAALTLDALSPTGLSRVLVLEGVNNPDNVGGIFRSALAFGVEAVVLGPGCGDPLYRKAIRTSMAATLRLPFADAGPWPDALVKLRDAGLTVVALTPDAGAAPLDRVSAGQRVALLLGNEGLGLTPAALAAVDTRVMIWMREGVDSLNVTVAASIAMHQLFQGR